MGNCDVVIVKRRSPLCKCTTWGVLFASRTSPVPKTPLVGTTMTRGSAALGTNSEQFVGHVHIPKETISTFNYALLRDTKTRDHFRYQFLK